MANKTLRTGRAPNGASLLFIRQAAESQTDDCILWPYSKTTYGYGQVRIDGRRVGAHKLALELAKGPAPRAGMHACHQPVICHNRGCINPRHLRWGDYKSKALDREVDQTVARGERQGSAKLTLVDVWAIRADDRTQATIAADYGVTQVTVSAIKRRTTWIWLPELEEAA